MEAPDAPRSYKRHRFPPAIIGHAVRRSFRFALSDRDVAELLAERGVILTYETVRQWCRKFGQAYANRLRRRRPRPGDKWHLDEVFITSNGGTHYLWHTVKISRVVRSVVAWRRTEAGRTSAQARARVPVTARQVAKRWWRVSR